MNAQCARALLTANEVRIGKSLLRREVRDGLLTLDAALDDPRARTLTIYELLCAQHRWGHLRAERVLRPRRDGRTGRDIWPFRRVGELTENEKQLVRQRVTRVVVGTT